jgi:hypothetical protein
MRDRLVRRCSSCFKRRVISELESGRMGPFAYRFDPVPTFPAWVGRLMDVHKVLERELAQAEQMGWPLELREQISDDGRRKLIVVVEAAAQGDFANDWCKDRSITESDSRRVYQFDAETERLERLEIWVHGAADEVLVLASDQIVFNEPVADDLFEAEVPDDVAWIESSDELPADEALAALTPDEVASRFFKACAARDWDTVRAFWPVSEVPAPVQTFLGGLEILSIGTPFQSRQYPGWFVPYKVRTQAGRILDHNLAVHNDNPAGRWIIDGGT